MRSEEDLKGFITPILSYPGKSRYLYQESLNHQQYRWRWRKFRIKTSEALGGSPNIKAIGDFMRRKLRYTYKRGSSRVFACKRRETPYLQSIFCSRVLGELHRNQIAINVDESSFSRSVKWHYSWLPKGRSSPIVNTNWTGSVSMIFSLFSNGEWIWVLKNGTTNSEDFTKFLLILETYWKKWLNIDPSSTFVTLDNAATHTSKRTRLAAQFLKFKFYFLPPYSPTLAPVELVFGILKRKISFKRRDKSISFGKKSGDEAITEAIKTLPTQLGLRLWAKFIHEAKEWILKCRERQVLSAITQTMINRPN